MSFAMCVVWLLVWTFGRGEETLGIEGVKCFVLPVDCGIRRLAVSLDLLSPCNRAERSSLACVLPAVVWKVDLERCGEIFE